MRIVHSVTIRIHETSRRFSALRGIKLASEPGLSGVKVWLRTRIPLLSHHEKHVYAYIPSTVVLVH